MGFARLYFLNNDTISAANVMYDIVRCITGTITSTDDLSYATRISSTIINTQNSNWTLAYPATIGSVGNVAYILSAPCVDSNKTKWVRLVTQHYHILGTTLNYRSSFASSTGAGILMQSATAANVATTTLGSQLTNQTFYYSGGASTSVQGVVNGNYINISWSQRHLLIHSNFVDSSNTKGFTASFEYAETNATQFANVAPVVHIQYVRNDYLWNSSLTSPGNDSGNINWCVVLNHYNPQTRVTSGLHNVLSDINGDRESMPLISDDSTGAFPLIVTKNINGAFSVPVQPLWFHQNHLGLQTVYVSNLSRVFRTAPNIAQENDTVTIGNDTYVYLPTAGYRYALLVPRA